MTRCDICYQGKMFPFKKEADHLICDFCKTVVFAGREIDYQSYYNACYYNGDLYRSTNGRIGYDSTYWQSDGGTSAKRNKIILQEFKWRFYGGTREIDSWLDIGCGVGHFLHHVSEYFNVGSLTGTELNGVIVDRARELYGLKVVEVPDQKYEVISLLGSLEHIGEDINDFVKMFSSYAKPNARLIILVPNGGSLNFRLYNTAWNLFIPGEHVRYFTHKGLHHLLARHGWTLDYLRTIGEPFHNSRSAHQRLVDTVLQPFFSSDLISHITNQMLKNGPLSLGFYSMN